MTVLLNKFWLNEETTNRYCVGTSGMYTAAEITVLSL